MRARKLLENAALGSDHLSVLYQAFDDAWEVVKHHHSTNPQSTEDGRLGLANAVLAAYRDGLTNPAALTAAAVRLMQRWD